MGVYPDDLKPDLPGSPFARVAPPEATRFQDRADEYEEVLRRIDRRLNTLRGWDDDAVARHDVAAITRALTALEAAETALVAVEERR